MQQSFTATVDTNCKVGRHIRHRQQVQQAAAAAVVAGAACLMVVAA
jgi:hypothetical protein